MQERVEKFAPAAALALYLVLLGTVLVLAGVGGRLYGVLSGSRAANDARRASLTYVAARLRAADAAGAVRVESRPEGDALVLDDGSATPSRGLTPRAWTIWSRTTACISIINATSSVIRPSRPTSCPTCRCWKSE